MSQFNAPVRRSGGSLDVYTALLFVATLVLGAGCLVVALRNMEHSKVGNQPGGLMTLVERPR
ncbi:MAG: hypothetical protein KF817_11510 [Phycisphaeraceae bacterium]|nr:hypothetical protein [Phycisphaeraceae bacterium]